jgi:SRSO17 transposase
LAWQLYLPQEWAEDAVRSERAGVPTEIGFATKPDIALGQLRQAVADGVPEGIVLADAAYGTNTAWRDGLVALGLNYAVGVVASIGVWPPGVEPKKPPRWTGKGRPPVRYRRTSTRQPCPVKELALTLEAHAYRTVSWREGSNQTLSSRFAAVRVRAAQGERLRPEEWLLIEWPRGEAEPTKYFLSNLPPGTPLKRLVGITKARWRIERDYQDLKQEFGLDHYEGRGWRGFHHHATLCIAAYGFLVGERLRGAGQKKPSQRAQLALPSDFIPRGSAPATRPTARRKLHRDPALAAGKRDRRPRTAAKA